MLEKIDELSRYGYIRVSSESQKSNFSLENQRSDLIKFGIPNSNIYLEVVSGEATLENRPILLKLVQKLKNGDALVVTKIDRCSRNTLDFLRFQQILFEKQVLFISLDLPHSQDLAVNQLIATTLASISTFESQRRKERQRKGIEAAKKAGKYLGRKSVITQELINKVRMYKEENFLGVSEIAKITGKSRSTIYRVLKEHLNYQPARVLIKSENKDQNESNESNEL